MLRSYVDAQRQRDVTHYQVDAQRPRDVTAGVVRVRVRVMFDFSFNKKDYL